MPHHSKITRGLLFGVTITGIGCVPPGDGERPPADSIYFPVSLTVNQTGEYLFVVNSDFDLRYSQGTIQSLDVARIREVAQRVCSRDADCAGDESCDNEPTDENDGSPSFSCVGPSGVPCEGVGEKSSEDLSYAPGRCAPIDLSDPPDGGSSLIVDVAETSAFATQGLLLQRPCLDGGSISRCGPNTSSAERIQSANGESFPERLFVPVRGDTTIHYLDIDEDGRFHCGRSIEDTEGISSSSLRCDTPHRISEGVTLGLSSSGEVEEVDRPPLPAPDDDEEVPEGDPIEAFRLPPEPLDLSASEDGRVIVVSHQLGGYATTLLNSWIDAPQMIHILEGLSANPIGVAGLPGSDGLQAGNQPGFLLTYRSNPRVELLRFVDDGLLQATSPEGPTEEQIDMGESTFRPELVSIAGTSITLNTAGFDSRGLAVDDSRRRAATEACGDDEDCRETASAIPLDVYVTNRTPNSLLVGRTGGEDPEALVSALPQFYSNIPLTAGPSRAVVGYVINSQGERSLRVFVLCFDSALVYVYDPERGEIETEFRTGRGPYSIAFDEEAGLAFIGHFTDSYIGVVSIDQRHPMTFGATVATLGDPEPPRAAK